MNVGDYMNDELYHIGILKNIIQAGKSAIDKAKNLVSNAVSKLKSTKVKDLAKNTVSKGKTAAQKAVKSVSAKWDESKVKRDARGRFSKKG